MFAFLLSFIVYNCTTYVLLYTEFGGKHFLVGCIGKICYYCCHMSMIARIQLSDLAHIGFQLCQILCALPPPTGLGMRMGFGFALVNSCCCCCFHLKKVQIIWFGIGWHDDGNCMRLSI